MSSLCTVEYPVFPQNRIYDLLKLLAAFENPVTEKVFTSGFESGSVEKFQGFPPTPNVSSVRYRSPLLNSSFFHDLIVLYAPSEY